MKILFTGDVNFRHIEPVDSTMAKSILIEVQSYIADADFRIVNLETPLADRDKYTPIHKAGPNLICMPENMAFLTSFHTDGVTLANNHIGDYGDGALRDTLSLLDEHHIRHAGAGENLTEAYKPMCFTKDGMTVAVLSVCENEFGLATDSAPGSAAYRPRALLRAIREAHAQADYVILCFHGGNEHNPVPGPMAVERYRLFCDMGADAVVAGHTHCPQGYELYDGKPILYSMGNFLFSSSTSKEQTDSWHYGSLCMLTIENGIRLELIPYRFTPDAKHITVFQGEDKARMLDYLQTLSAPLSDPAMLRGLFSGWAWLHRWVPSLEGWDKPGYNDAGNFDLISCEAHRDQLYAIFHTHCHGSVDEVKQWAEKVQKLMVMPV